MGASMAILSLIYKYGIWISVPAFIFFVILLVICITNVVRTGRQARLFSVPLLDQQEIEFTNAGRVVLCMEGPMLSRRFAKLKYELTGPDGMAVKSRFVLFRATTTGLTKARMELKVYEIAFPGRYVFEIRGLEGERPSDSEHQMVFMRPHLAHSMVYVIGIVFTSIFIIVSIVLFFLQLLNVSNSLEMGQRERKAVEDYATMRAYQASASGIRETGRDGHFIAYDNGTVLDARTNLMWASKDNGRNINWQDAKNYCYNYRGGGYTDWRMPMQNELAGLYDNSKTYTATKLDYEVHLTELIKLSTSNSWALETRGSEAASFFFQEGQGNWENQSYYKARRILPVRSAK
jgi:hypothetical protein